MRLPADSEKMPRVCRSWSSRAVLTTGGCICWREDAAGRKQLGRCPEGVVGVNFLTYAMGEPTQSSAGAALEPRVGSLRG